MSTDSTIPAMPATLQVTDTEVFMPFMRDVARCEQSLQELNLMWRIIESSAKMNCPVEAKTILPTMAATREGFAKLEQELVASLVQEKVRNVMDGIATKAQYVIDIVVRNLFERTADVGFLATDRVLCEFLAADPDDADARREEVRRRLQEYRSKYTVYDEILLLDTQGRVMVQVDAGSPVTQSADPLVAETLASESYVETFRATDLRPQLDRALVYSRRMHHPETGAVVGLLCLGFNLAQEMQGIFDSHRDGDERANLLLLDADDRVIASADPLWLPPGTRLPTNVAGSPMPCVFGGREYLVRTFRSAGYQGYPGPAGWQGQVMVPVDVAFRGNAGTAGDVLAGLEPAVAEGLLSHADSFCPPLFEIMSAARTIQRIVWNGQVMTVGQEGDMAKLKTVLDQISETGNRSNELFARSIRDLYQTVLASSLRNAQFTSHLLVDLLDRNLYERSDDCRWWALTPELRAGLAEATLADDTRRRFGDILAYINGLYTVYTRLFVYDRDGTIVASTGDAALGTPERPGMPVVGAGIAAQTLSSVLALRTAQDYHVSPFEPTGLYGDADTYVYHAAIRDLADPGRIVGGIGIVFDSTPEFLNMLRAGLAGKSETKSKALYVARDGRILSSTDPTRQVGTRLALDADLLALPAGRGASRITEHDGQYGIVACTASSGYREFKTSDGYQEDVLAVVFETFGAVRSGAGLADRSALRIDTDATRAAGTEYATFFCRESLYAIAALHVLEAVPYSDVRPTPLGGGGRIGILGLQRAELNHRFMWVYDLAQLIGADASRVTGNSQVLVLRHGAHTIGLLVDDLHAVPQFAPAQIIRTPLAVSGQSMLVTEVIKANRGELLIQAVDIPRLFAWLIDGIEPGDDPAGGAQMQMQAA
ncbi:chemotaxis protein CheW [Xylophilus sp. GOD-11R]|uniref:chemotaxis protein CheW n=1 Tax=Xylophilus sp. GOD-11R TaxID=3089814 RepID=UPI00298D5E9E|nr:chemotaxis protein CheW [Xylophilus sp. GOD-11R]WPB55242.1 chemotaxis protein CheW [Xylophilus sp. GOD-11R]